MRRLTFTFTTLTALVLLPNQQHVARAVTPEPPVVQASPSLTMELRSAHALPQGTSPVPSIEVDLAIKNNSDQEIVLLDCKGSWGSNQWEYELIDATGKKFILKKTQKSRTHDVSAVIKIAPGSEFLMPSFLGPLREGSRYKFANSRITDEKGRLVQPSNSTVGWKYPVTIVGKLNARIVKIMLAADRIDTLGNWSGDIATPPIVLKAPTQL